MKRYAAALVVAFGMFVGTVHADDPTGTWKWSTGGGGGGQARESTVTLKLEGDKLTGAMMGRNNQETAISDASFKDGVVTFSITTERNGQKRTRKYSGKLEGDTIKGKTTFDRNGQEQSNDWEAKRSK